MSDLAAWFDAPFFAFFPGERRFFSALMFHQRKKKRCGANRNVDSDKREGGHDFKIDLLDALSIQADCTYLSDLHHLNDWQRARLVRALE